jgi:hypothetical protein
MWSRIDRPAVVVTILDVQNAGTKRERYTLQHLGMDTGRAQRQGTPVVRNVERRQLVPLDKDATW